MFLSFRLFLPLLEPLEVQLRLEPLEVQLHLMFLMNLSFRLFLTNR